MQPFPRNCYVYFTFISGFGKCKNTRKKKRKKKFCTLYALYLHAVLRCAALIHTLDHAYYFKQDNLRMPHYNVIHIQILHHIWSALFSIVKRKFWVCAGVSLTPFLLTWPTISKYTVFIWFLCFPCHIGFLKHLFICTVFCKNRSLSSILMTIPWWKTQLQIFL